MAVLFSPTSVNKKGFSLIELLIVIAIIAALSALGLFGYLEGVRRAKVAQAQGDLDRLKAAIAQLQFDTSQHPGHDPVNTCVLAEGALLFDLSLVPGGTGLVTTDGLYPNWKGPYIEEVPEDPWGQPYYMTGRYACKKTTAGCKGVPEGTLVRAVFSGGANESGANSSDDDNVVQILCR
jgi:prepilin-type N-terminal cleavage/methylation domain-containing protein